MTQRFGRNQRRRAREQIAGLEKRICDLEAAHILDRELLAHNRTKLSAAQSEIDHAKYVAGRLSILFPVDGTLPVSFKSTDGCDVRIHTPAPFSFAGPDDEIGPIAQISLQTQPLGVLLTRIRPDALGSAIHVRVSFSDGFWGYGITRQAWGGLGPRGRERMVQDEVSRDLSRLISKHNFR